jgi:YfiH family protein
MTVERGRFLCDHVLIDVEIEHGFGLRDAQPPEKTVFPSQVHGIDVFEATSLETRDPPRADVVLSTTPGLRIGIVTADCVPILVAADDGSAVAAIHAGWRGLAKGVIEAGVGAMMAAAKGAGLVAAIGPAGRACCYEVDDPVRVALAENYSQDLEEALTPGRADHSRLDLPLLASRVLAKNGVDCHRIGIQNRVCTICDPDRFESYRRDGVASGRLTHFITTPGGSPTRVDSLQGGP